MMTVAELVTALGDQQYTILPAARLRALHDLAESVAHIPGALVECGCYHGGSATILAHGLGPQHPAWLFDSFLGLPEPGPQDGDRALYGWLARRAAGTPRYIGSVDRPAAAFHLAGWTGELHVIPGWFADTVPAATIGPLALLHIDADWYASVKVCLQHFYPLLVAGGLLILDDFGYWPGCQQAVADTLPAVAQHVTFIDNTSVYYRKAI
jgi:O-methyltransferase